MNDNIENNNIQPENNNIPPKKPTAIVTIVLAVVALVATLGIVLSGNNPLPNPEHPTEQPIEYPEANYEIVEGFVEDFEPMPYEGKSKESFEINGVKFSYSDSIEICGYNNAKSHGGVIEGNGQHLKIGYIYYDSSYGNIIVYIEQLE